ncbi:MAG TPA: hypothetical protein VGC77_14505 [Rhodopseudomonas sp.]|uniref:hypothetical protein n=1 Tax=Rhodopseudomonas sp. TaxID=1078 RepID=UPI002EDBB1E0
MQSILQREQPAFVGIAARRVAEFDQPDVGVLLDAMQRPADDGLAAMGEAGDLDQRGILDFDRLVERPFVSEHGSRRAGQHDHCGERDEQAVAKRPDHLGRSNNTPTLRALQIGRPPWAAAPSIPSLSISNPRIAQIPETSAACRDPADCPSSIIVSAT